MTEEIVTKSIATKGKVCHGSLDGKTYFYADGTEDQGESVTLRYIYYEKEELPRVTEKYGNVYDCWDANKKLFIYQVKA